MEFKQEKKNNQVKVRVALLSVCSNTSLVIGKLAVGTLVGSVSIISEAIHSCMDLLAAAIAFFAVKTSDTPPDQEHPYGHGKIENVASGIEALLILSAGAWIIYESVKKIIHPEPMKMVWLVSGSCFFFCRDLFVSKKLFKTGEETNSPAPPG
jgi:cation diffusion facilitator family transporter